MTMFIKTALVLILLFVVGCGVYYFFENKNSGNSEKQAISEKRVNNEQQAKSHSAADPFCGIWIQVADILERDIPATETPV